MKRNITTLLMLFCMMQCALCIAAQTANDASSMKYVKIAAPVANQGPQGNRPAGEFYHATYTGAAWGDYDNDGFIDLYYSDRNTLISNTTVFSNLYNNNQNGTFNRILRPGISSTAFSCPVWLDMNNDGNLDLFLSGLSNWSYNWNDTLTQFDQIVTHLYLGDGEGGFTEVPDCGVRPIYNGLTGGRGHNWVSAGDFDHDGYTDLVMTGFDDAARPLTDHPENAVRAVYLYRNIDGEHFELQPLPVEGKAPFIGMNDGSVNLIDLDGDGWLDVFTTGYGYSHNAEGYIYWNNGDGTFTSGDTLPVWALTNASCSATDLDNDGLPDLVLTGIYTDTGSKCFTLCHNNGDRTFSAVDSDNFEPIDGGQLAFGDTNQDGWIDILVGGHGQTHEHTTWLYLNQGGFNFDIWGAHYDDPFGKIGSFGRVTHGSHHLIDYDNDGYLDAWFNGWANGGCSNGCLTDLYQNVSSTKGIPANASPEPPTGLNATVSAGSGSVSLSWLPGSDDFTPTSALRYNVYIKHLATDKTFMLVPADLSTGFVKVEALNAAISPTSYEMTAADGDYEWGVQCIDNGNRGSAFATGTFSIANSGLERLAPSPVSLHGSSGHIHYCVGNDANIHVYNTLGMLVGETAASGSGVLSVQSPGIYVVTVTQGNKTYTQKIAL